MAVVLLAVAGAIVLVGVVAGLELFGANTSPLDTERTEQWFVRHAPRPIRHVLQRADKRFAGGALVAVVFVMLLLASVAVGWILDTVDENRGFARWDESAAKWGSAHATTSTTRLLEFATQFGATGWLLIVLGIIGLIRWQIDRRPSALAYLAVVGLGVSALNNGLKHLVDRERPNVMQLTGFGGSSFPSGHTAAAAACWAALALVAARRRSRALRTVAAAVAMCITVAVASSPRAAGCALADRCDRRCGGRLDMVPVGHRAVRRTAAAIRRTGGADQANRRRGRRAGTVRWRR